MKSIAGYLKTKKLKRMLERPPYIFRQQVEEVKILFAVHTWLEYHNRARDSYTGEPDMVDFIKKELKSGDVFWDIGANVGAYSLLAAKITHVMQVIAFEPYIPTFAHLWDNISINGCNKAIAPLCMGLSDHTNIDCLGVSDPRAGSSNHVMGGGSLDETQPSMAIRGDDAVNMFGLNTPDVVKIDVDGYELFVLKGMTGILKNKKLRSLIVEVDMNATRKEVIGLLGGYGFQEVSNSHSLSGASVFNIVFRRYS